MVSGGLARRPPLRSAVAATFFLYRARRLDKKSYGIQRDKVTTDLKIVQSGTCSPARWYSSPHILWAERWRSPDLPSLLYFTLLHCSPLQSTAVHCTSLRLSESTL